MFFACPVFGLPVPSTPRISVRYESLRHSLAYVSSLRNRCFREYTTGVSFDEKDINFITAYEQRATTINDSGKSVKSIFQK